MDAPIFDPDGRLIAALDISSARGDHDRTMAALIGALVQDAARSIERDLFCRRYSDARSFWPVLAIRQCAAMSCWPWIAMIS
jgi:transcriptional regulator of acetoin/glycerol metabolism